MTLMKGQQAKAKTKDELREQPFLMAAGVDMERNRLHRNIFKIV